jgi:hypothetical protein
VTYRDFQQSRCGLVLKSSFAAVRTFGEAEMAESTRRVIVIARNGSTTVISRRQAWVCGIGLLLAAWRGCATVPRCRDELVQLLW